jgi:hypothetical protein
VWVAVVAAGVLAAPATASAANTYTVTNGGSIQDAVNGAGPGDRIQVMAGTYNQDVSVPTGKDNLTIVGLGGPRVNGAFKIASAGVTLDSLLLQRDSGPSAPVLDVTATAAPAATLTKSIVVQNSDGPGVQSAGGGLNVVDSSVLASTGNPAVRINGGSSTITRSSLNATGNGGNGLEVTSAAADATAKTVSIDSSIVAGAGGGAGLKLSSASGIPMSNAGPITVNAVHLTTAGSAKGIVLDAAANGGAPPLGGGAAGAITANVRSSIVHGDNPATAFAGDIGHPASAATLNLSDTDTTTPDAKLFVNPGARDFHLLASAPVIDTVPGPANGESDRDVDGDPRVTTGNGFGNKNLADKGADEYANRPPTAKLSTTTPTARERVGVPFDASDSSDPNAGGAVAAYAYSYGDGTSETSGSPHALHAYAQKGVYNATVSVLDAQGGLSSPSAPVAVVITDGTSPVAGITAPANGAKIKAGRAIPIAGRAADESGVQSVQVSVRYAGASVRKAKAGAAKAQKKKAKKATCLYVSPRSKLVKGSCSSATYYAATLADFDWRFGIRKHNRLPRGSYEVRVRATDTDGNATDTPSAGSGTLTKFRIV